MKTTLFAKIGLYGLFFAIVIGMNGCSSDAEPGNELQSRAPIVLEENESSVNDALNNVSMALMCTVIEKSGNENIMVSPVGANMVMGMIANATSGTTYTEICNALGFNDLTAYNSLNAKILEQFPQADNKADVKIHNAMWGRVEFVKPAQSYSDILASDYKAPLNLVNEMKKTDIDSWASQVTDGKITDITRKEIEIGNMTIGAWYNVLYFNCPWQEKFDVAKTAKANFTNADGTVARVDMMNSFIEKSTIWNSSDAQIVGIPYGQTEHFTFYAVLPSEGVSLSTALKTLKSNPNLPHGGTGVSISMPKFKQEAKVNLIPIWQAMGVNEMFTDEGEFMNIGIGRDIASVSLFDQTIVFETNENGSELKVVTEGNMQLTSPGPGGSVTLDRPFAFFVVEDDTKAILIAGAINKL